MAPVCEHIDKVCRYCKRKGHLDRVCRVKARVLALVKSDSPAKTGPSATVSPIDEKPPKQAHHLQEEPEQDDSHSSEEYSLNPVRDDRSSPFTMTLLINDNSVQMEVNTGAAVSIINEATSQRVQQSTGDLTLEPATTKPKTYTGQDIAVLGVAPLTIRYKSKQLYLSVHVVSGTGPNLLGRDLITPLGVDLDKLKVPRAGQPSTGTFRKTCTCVF